MNKYSNGFKQKIILYKWKSQLLESTAKRFNIKGKDRDKRNNNDAMRMEGGRNNRKRSMSVPYTFTFEYTTEISRITNYSMFKRKK